MTMDFDSWWKSVAAHRMTWSRRQAAEYAWDAAQEGGDADLLKMANGLVVQAENSLSHHAPMMEEAAVALRDAAQKIVEAQDHVSAVDESNHHWKQLAKANEAIIVELRQKLARCKGGL